MKSNYCILIIIFSIILFSCDDEYSNPGISHYKITTYNATNISETSADIKFTIAPEYKGESGIFLSEDITFVNGKMYRNLNLDTHCVSLSNLENNKKYYYRAYIGGTYGDFIFGDIFTFTTKDIVPTILTGNTVIKSKEYIKEGYVSDETTYYYKYTIEFPVIITGAIKFSECGAYIIDSHLYFKSLTIKNGVNTLNLDILSTVNSWNLRYRSYGKLTNGEYIYGDIKYMTLTYY